MAKPPLRDHRNRPVVAITGIGMISSLGVGLDENWKAVTAGKSGVHRITRFPTTHLKTTIAGTIDYLTGDFQSLTLQAGELAGDEAVKMAGLGKPGDFPGPLFTAIPPVEMEWRLRRRLYNGADPAIEDAYDRMISVAAEANDHHEYEQLMYGHVGEKLAERLGTKGAPI